MRDPRAADLVDAPVEQAVCVLSDPVCDRLEVRLVAEGLID